MYLNTSDYLGQIRQYQRCFALERFLFLRFEDLRAEPQETVARCLDFLGVEEIEPVRTEAVGKHRGYRLGRVGRLAKAAGEKAPGMQHLQRRVWSWLPAHVQDSFRRRLTRPIPSMDHDLRERLEARYRPMIDPLEELTGLDLSGWRAEYGDPAVTPAGNGDTRTRDHASGEG